MIHPTYIHLQQEVLLRYWKISSRLAKKKYNVSFLNFTLAASFRRPVFPSDPTCYTATMWQACLSSIEKSQQKKIIRLGTVDLQKTANLGRPNFGRSFAHFYW